MKKIGFGLLLAVVLGFFAYYGSLDIELTKEFDRTNKYIKIIVITHENEEDLTASFQKHLGKELDEDYRKRNGFATWSRVGKEPLTCNIHVVVPKSENDNGRMATWGHELLHCVHGRFHK